MSRRPVLDRWREIDDLFDRALDLDPPDLDSFLGRHCLDDAAARREIIELLRAEERARGFLGPSAAKVLAAELTAALREGRRVPFSL